MNASYAPEGAYLASHLLALIVGVVIGYVMAFPIARRLK